MMLKRRIIAHYDELSPYYRDLWGLHLHHGYWRTGSETKEQAQEQLIGELIARAGVGRGARILDVGCGLGATAIYLSKNLDAKVIGITISPKQVEIGNGLASQLGADVQLLLMDAERLDIEDRFDVVWSVEAISHLDKKANFFGAVARLMKTGGKLVIADWFKSGSATAEQQRRFLAPIERAMLVPSLEAPDSYAAHIREAGLDVILFEDVSANVSRTWDLAIEIVRNPALWKFAAARGRDFVAFLEGFASMRAGYASKAFVYGVLIAQKT